MIRVMHLVSTFEVKTDTKWLVRLLGRMDRQGFEVVVGSLGGSGPIEEQLAGMGIATFSLGVARAWDVRVVGRLVGKIKEYSPDIIHTHLLRADLYGGLAGKVCGRKVVSTVYAYGDYRRMHRRGRLDWWLDRASTRFADRFIAVCEAIRDDLVGRVGIRPERVCVIQTGMDAVEVEEGAVMRRREGLQIGEEEKVVLVPARLSYEKGVDCFLRAVRDLVAQGVKARFLVTGSGPMEGELLRLSEELGISDQVRFLGFIDDVETVMRMSDVVVLPSYSEGLPNAALEAFSVRRPLVASRVGGLMDLGKIDPAAIEFFQPNNPADLADRIKQVLADFSLADRMAMAGRRIIEERLSTEQVARRYEDMYREVLKI
jgi:glycosyltransferase involved in cell wall biosynthesis